jgi:hypothetical protein
MPPRLFANPVFRAATAAGFLVNLARWSAIVYLPLYFQLVRGATATESGLRLLPLLAAALVGSVGSGHAIARVGRYKPFPVAGTALATIGLVLLTRIGDRTGWPAVTFAMVIVGLGLGMVLQVLVLTLQNAVDPADLGIATGTAAFFRAIGASFGVAVFGTVFASELRRASYAHALHEVFVVAVPFAALGFLVTLFLRDLPLREDVGALEPAGYREGR